VLVSSYGKGIASDYQALHRGVLLDGEEQGVFVGDQVEGEVELL